MTKLMEKKNLSIEIFGWYGMIAILLAYGLISLQFLGADNVWYQSLNLTGALGVASVAYYKKAGQPAVLNLIWAVIALVALIRIFI